MAMPARRGRLASVKGISRSDGSWSRRSGPAAVIGDEPGAPQNGGHSLLNLGPGGSGQRGAGDEDQVPTGRDGGQVRPGGLGQGPLGGAAGASAHAGSESVDADAASGLRLVGSFRHSTFPMGDLRRAVIIPG